MPLLTAFLSGSHHCHRGHIAVRRQRLLPAGAFGRAGVAGPLGHLPWQRLDTARATADSAGCFHFESTTIERNKILIVPAIERFFNSYALCAGAADSSLRIAYVGQVPLRVEQLPPDTVSCLQWV